MTDLVERVEELVGEWGVYYKSAPFCAKDIIKTLDGRHGWKLVPVEPTEEMLTAGCRPYMDKKGGIEIYRDMLAASPDPLD